MVVPDLDGVLPVYVLDRYAGFEVVRVPGLDPQRMSTYLHAHELAMRWVLTEARSLEVGNGKIGGVLINHAAPLPSALAPVLTSAGIPFAVKVHGSELEYALAEDASLIPSTSAALAQASSVLVGSTHIEQRTRELVGDDAVEGRIKIIPPGVDLQRFRPLKARIAQNIQAEQSSLIDELQAHEAQPLENRRGPSHHDEVKRLVEQESRDLVKGLKLLGESYEERQVDAGASDQIAQLDLSTTRLAVFVGKLIPQKGVHLLLAALPFVMESHPNLHVVVAGFGPMRDALEALLYAMRTQKIEAIEELASSSGSLSGEGSDSLPHLAEWFTQARSTGEAEQWLELASRHRIDEHVTFLGLVDHGVLEHLWPLAEISVVPSILSEAFGMVAAEAAACGCVPVVSDHSGLADAALVIERNAVAPVRFNSQDKTTAIRALGEVLDQRLSLPESERARQSATARANVSASWGWDQIAKDVALAMCEHT